MHLESHEVFRAVVEYGSVTKAAVALHMTQSTASRYLQALEDEYGGLLFDRTATGLTLTAMGSTLYPLTCDLLSCHARAKDELTRLRREGGGLCVGATLTIGEYVLPQVLGEFRRSHPKSEIRMRISNTSDVLDHLLHHRIDIGLIEGMVSSDTEFTVSDWAQDELVLVCSPAHRFASVSRIAVNDLAGEPMLEREEGSGTRQITEMALERAGIRSAVVFAMELGSTQAIKSAIAAGLGVAFLSRLAIADDCSAGKLVQVPIADFCIRRNLAIVERAERYTKYMVKEFLRQLRLTTF